MWFVRAALGDREKVYLKKKTESLEKCPSNSLVSKAAALWKNANTNTSQIFERIRSQLRASCPGHEGERFCTYCEHSSPDWIDHVRPKSRFPMKTFAWDNLVYACASCQQIKGEKWFLMIDDALFEPEVDDARADASSLYLEPTRDDPQRFLTIDCLGTWSVVPRQDLSPRDARRARETIALYALDERNLPQGRKRAAQTFQFALHAYVEERKERGFDPARLAEVRARHAAYVRALPHRSTLLAINEHYAALSGKWRSLSSEAPESLEWISDDP